MASRDVDFNVHISVAKPGDTVIIGFDRVLTDEEVEWMNEQFIPIIASGVQVMFADQVSSMIVVKGETGGSLS